MKSHRGDHQPGRRHLLTRRLLVLVLMLSIVPIFHAQADPTKPAPPGYPFTGTKHYVSLLCRFGDDPSTPHQSDYYRALMGDQFPGMRHYWNEVSFGNLDLRGEDVFGWYDLPQPRGYYFHDDGRTDGEKIKNDCTAAADADVFFPDYDGIILWLNGDLSHLGHGGRLTLALDGMEKNYGRVLMADQEEPWGILAHEIGHGFDWRAHSSTGPCCDGDSSWDLMGGISFGCSASWLDCIPVHPLAYRKLTAGWIPAEETFVAGPSEQRTVRINSVSDAAPSGVLIARVPIRGSSTRFYTVEVRRQVGYDEGLLREGVLIHYVDAVKDHVWLQLQPDDVNDAGRGNWLTGDTFVDDDTGISISIGEGDPSTGFDVTIETPAWAPPPNDEPGSAAVIGSPDGYTHSVFTDLATATGSEPILSCTGERPTNSVWYRVTPSSHGWFSFSTTGSDYPAVIAMFEATAAGLNEIRCGYDYGWEDSPRGADGLHDVPLAAGTTYLIEVGSLGWENGGELNVGTRFSVSSEPLPPPGDTPDGPTGELVRHGRSVAFRLRDHLLATGRVSVADGFSDCWAEAVVKVQRRKKGTWRTVWVIEARGAGRFKTSLIDRPGRYRAVVPALTPDGHHCVRAVSATRRHSHS